MCGAEPACAVIDSDDEDFDGTVAETHFAGAKVTKTRFGADDSDDEEAEDDDWAFEVDDYGRNFARPMYGSQSATLGQGQLQPVGGVALRAQAHLSSAARTDIALSEKKLDAPRNLGLTRDTRATVEQVLDPRTLLVLGKMLKRGVYAQIFGTISTGKEANVYYATGHKPSGVIGNLGEYLPEGADCAVKVYKTSILVFKDRARYVEGEFRFRRGYCKSNPRKMVAMWAEKEMRNLRRMRSASLPCPIPVEVRQNVLVMEHIGVDGKAAPRLKDAEVEREEWPRLYTELLRIIRTMFQVCKLVHGDLSEYNVLYHNGSLNVIDVSQSVEHDHPQALEFLKRDLVNVNDFFGRMAVQVVPVQPLFDFVVARDDSPPPAAPTEALPERMEEELQRLLREAPERDEEREEQDEVDEQVFLNTFTPSTLNQVFDVSRLEKDMKKREAGAKTMLDAFDRLIAQPKLREEDEQKEDDDEAETEKAEESADDEDADGSESEPEAGPAGPNGHKLEGMTKAEWKAQVKAERAEKRKAKMPKHEKKKRTGKNTK